MNRVFSNSIFVLISMVIMILICTSPLLPLQNSLKFPLYLKFKVYQNRQPIGNASLCYNRDTGLKRFNRDIASLRWNLRREGGSEVQYMEEAYIFNDDLSLYQDAMISSERGIYSQFTLEDLNPNERTFVSDKGSSIQNITNTDIDISMVSSLLLAAQKISDIYKSDKMYRYISHDGNHKPIRILYVAQMQENIAGKSVPVFVISLTHNNREIHRYKFYKDATGYCYPVAVYFDINDTQRSLELLLEEYPRPQTPQNPHQTSVVYLDFMESNSQSLKNQTVVDKLVRGSFYSQIKKELYAAIIGSGKQPVLDMKSGSQMNTAVQIKQLIDITFEQDIPVTEKINKIMGRLKVPPQVDIIVTGQYIDNPGGSNIMIRPVIILKNNPAIKTSNLMFNRAQLLCRSPGSGQQIPCQDSENYIAKIVRQFLLPALKFNGDNQEFTIDGVYRMIMDNRYFCHSIDYGYHYEVLERLKELDRIEERDSVKVTRRGSGEASRYSYTFKSGWEVKAVSETNKKIVKTVSADKNDYAKVISLYWDLVEGSETTYDKALQMIEVLNASNNEGHADWRLPTLEELLCITSEQSTQPYFFPFILPSKKVNMIWTSTLLEEDEKRRLTGSETATYFVLKRSNNIQVERVHFDILEKDRKAFFLPVRSPISAGRISSQSGNKALLIANLSFMKTLDRSPMVSSDLGQAINKVATNGMNMAVAFNNAFTIIDGNQPSFSTDSNANLLANIFFNPNLTNEKKVKQTIDTLMRPYKIDLLVTGIFIDDGSDVIRVRPMVIYKYNQTIKTGNLQFKRAEFECWDNVNRRKTICPQAAAQIAIAVKELLEQS